MKIHIGCCDDDKEQIELYKKFFANFNIRTDFELEVEYFLSGKFLLEHFRKGDMFDIVFLDMQMPDVSGLEVAREIRFLRGRDTRIIFLTSFPEYMQDSFDVRAFHYIIKPVKFDEFERKLKDALEDLTKEETDIVIFKGEDSDIILRTCDVVYIEKQKGVKMICIHEGHERILAKANMNTIEEVLKNKHFIRTHRAILVNMRHIKRIRKNEVVLSNGEIVPLSRRKELELKEFFMKYTILETRR